MSMESSFVSSLTTFQTVFPEASHSKVGWLEKSKRIWRATHNTVEFFERDTGCSLYCWEYKQSKSATIFNVCECVTPHGRIYYLVTIQLASSNLVCLMEFNRLIKVIELPFTISCVCFFNHSTALPRSPLSSFHGVMVCGCHGGHVIAMDLQLDVGMEKSINVYKKIVHSSIREILPKDSPKVARQQLLKDGIHAYFNLNRYSVQRSGQFTYRAPDGEEYDNFPSRSVVVTAVAYLAQTTSLAVGYSFGGLQLFNLDSLFLMFSSIINQANPLAPISHIVLQEPENDPRKYLFLWVGHSPTAGTKSSPMYVTKMVMYQLAFEMEQSNQCGVVIGCMLKLEFPLSSDPYILSKKLSVGSNLISCSTAPGLFSRDPAATGDDLTILIFVWKSQSPEDGKMYHVGVFDLNRWYYAQMPRSVRWEKTVTTASTATGQHTPKVCSFLAFHSLGTAVEEAGEPLMEAMVTRVSRFYSPPPTCEAHQWPSSLSFDMTCMYSSALQHCNFLGLQESVLRRFVTLGSSALDDPSDLYSHCVAVHLLPQPVHDSLSNSVELIDNESQRRALLGLALERDLFSVLYSCARSWTTGVLTPEGCTLAALLEWVWLKLVQLKQEKDQLCQPLFVGVRIGDCLIQQLLRTHRSLTYLTDLFHVLLEITSTEQGHADLVSKCHGCAVHKNMLEVILWCIENKVLPQSVDESTHCLHYPLDKLKRLYAQLRHPKEPMTSNRRLLIDILHDEMECSEFMKADNLDGIFYPPDSMEQLINIYATQNTSIQHCIMIYHLTDLSVMVLNDDSTQFPNELVTSYAEEFSIPSQLASFAQGLWHLDHGNIEEAHKKLMHHLTTEKIDDVLFLLYTPIIESYMDNGGAQEFADLYGSRDPSGDSKEKTMLYIDLLVAAGRLSNAVAITRISKQSEHDMEMFNCFLDKCQQAKKLSLLISQPLTAEEDTTLCNYLEESPSLTCQELLVMFHIHRSRYVEAIRVNRQLNERQRTLHDPEVWERSDRRNAIVNGIARSLPGCLKSLAQTHPTALQQHHPSHQLQSQPQPMSTIVARQANIQVLSQAHYLSIAMQKVGETKSSPKQQQLQKPATPLLATPLPATPKSVISASVSEPFVLSPLLSWQKSTSRNKTVVTSRSRLLSTHKTPRSKGDDDDDDVQFVGVSVNSSLPVSSLMERLSKLKKLECVELPDSLKTPTMKKSPVINTSLELPSSLRLPHSILKQRQQTPALATTNLTTSQHGVSDSTDFPQTSTRKIRFAAPVSPDSPSSSIVKSKTTTSVDSPVIISDEEYFSPTDGNDKGSKDGFTSTSNRFATNFTASGEDMIDLTVDSSNPSSGVHTPDSTQQSPYPHIKLLDFLSPGVSPKDLARSIKKHSDISTSQLSTNVTSTVEEPATGEMPGTSAVLHYGVTARSPVSINNEPISSSVRQISPPQDPDELKRAALLPLDKRVDTPITTSRTSSSLRSARVSIHKFDSPSSALTASIAKGTVSLRKDRYQKQFLQASFNSSSTTSTSGNKLDPQYKFSPPVEVLSSDKISGSQEVNKSTTSYHSPNVSFPFSPPLTRSRRKEQDNLNDSKVELFSEMVSEMTSEVDVDPSIDMPEASEPKESGKKKPKISTSEVTTAAKRTYRTRSKTRSTPRVGSNYDTVLLHPMPTPGSTPSEGVTTRKPRQKVKPMNKPPLNLRRSSRLLDSTHTDSRRH